MRALGVPPRGRSTASSPSSSSSATATRGCSATPRPAAPLLDRAVGAELEALRVQPFAARYSSDRRRVPIWARESSHGRSASSSSITQRRRASGRRGGDQHELVVGERHALQPRVPRTRPVSATSTSWSASRRNTSPRLPTSRLISMPGRCSRKARTSGATRCSPAVVTALRRSTRDPRPPPPRRPRALLEQAEDVRRVARVRLARAVGRTERRRARSARRRPRAPRGHGGRHRRLRDDQPAAAAVTEPRRDDGEEGVQLGQGHGHGKP